MSTPDGEFDWIAAEDQFRDVAPILATQQPAPSSGAEQLIAAHRFADASRRLRQHLAAYPADTDGRRLLGWAQLGLTDLDGAAASARAVVAAAPNSPDAHLLAAAVHSARKEVAAARDAAAIAIRLAPEHPAPLRMAAAVDIDADQVTESTLAQAVRAVQLNPDDAVAQRLAGTASLELRRPRQAGEYLRRAAELDPDDPATAVELARWNASRGRRAAAAKGLAEVIRADPSDSVAVSNLKATVWQTFSVAQLVLWCATVVLSRVRLFTNGDPAAWSRIVGPLVVVLALATWLFQLRGSWRGAAAMLPAVRSDRVLSVGMLAHLLCLVALACTPLPGAAGTAALIAGLAFLLVATATIWIRARQEKRERG